MNSEEYKTKKIELLNIVAPNVVALSKKRKIQQVTAIASRVNEYMANKWDGSFASRYLNSDGNNQKLWLTMMGIENPTTTDCFILHRAMLFFNNHSLDHCFKSEWLKRAKINAYGNGENWCKLWVSLAGVSKDHIVKFF